MSDDELDNTQIAELTHEVMAESDEFILTLDRYLAEYPELTNIDGGKACLNASKSMIMTFRVLVTKLSEEIMSANDYIEEMNEKD